MKFEILRYSIRIIPEDEKDVAYIEEVLKLRTAQDTHCVLVRKEVFGTHKLAYVETVTVSGA